jgi:hypothetical protein
MLNCLSIPKNSVKHSTKSNAAINESPCKVPDCIFYLVKGHSTISFTIKKKNARAVITVFATADQIMSLCDNFSMNLFYFNSHALQ